MRKSIGRMSDTGLARNALAAVCAARHNRLSTAGHLHARAGRSTAPAVYVSGSAQPVTAHELEGGGGGPDLAWRVTFRERWRTLPLAEFVGPDRSNDAGRASGRPVRTPTIAALSPIILNRNGYTPQVDSTLTFEDASVAAGSASPSRPTAPLPTCPKRSAARDSWSNGCIIAATRAAPIIPHWT